jgi:hypothetical protein
MTKCKHTLLAKTGDFRIDKCSCGTLSLHIGAVSLRVSPEALFQLSSMMNTATENYLEQVNRLEQNHLHENRDEEQAPMTIEEFFRLKTKHNTRIH